MYSIKSERGGERIKISKQDEIDIVKMYVDDKKSSTEIAAIYGVTHRTILLKLKKNNTESRNLSDAHFAKHEKEKPIEFSNYDAMYDLYVAQGLSKKELGNKFNCAPHVIDRVLKNLRIPVRGDSQCKIGLMCGEEHPNWKGGLSSLSARCRQYFQTNISPRVRERDNYTCQMCGKHSNLHVHHNMPFSEIVETIVGEESMCPISDVNVLYEAIIKDSRFLDEDNLITYCSRCHLNIIHGSNKTISSEDLD